VASTIDPMGKGATRRIHQEEGKQLHPVDIPVQDAMRTIISCGAGSE